MPQLDAYVFFDGNCAEAMRFYEQALGGKVQTMVKAADAPPQARPPGGSGDAVMHAHLVLDGRNLLASDWMDASPYPGMKGFAISLVYPGVDEAQRAFDALAGGGKVNMPMQKTFCAESFGMLVDRFGLHWMVSGPSPQA